MSGASAKYVVRSLAVCLAICFATEAQARLAPEPLVQVWVAPRPLKTVSACIIKALDANERTYSKISPSVRHVAKTLMPGSVVDIRPVKEHVLADLDHYVRLEKIADVITRIAFHSSEDSTAEKKMEQALSPCGAR
jgi:hypothetical protein